MVEKILSSKRKDGSDRWVAQWAVLSFTDQKKKYKVSVAHTGRWACDCPAHRFAKAPKQDCKHIDKVQSLQMVAPPFQLNDVQKHFALSEMVKVEMAKNKITTAVRPSIVVSTPTMLVIQTRREIYLEED